MSQPTNPVISLLRPVHTLSGHSDPVNACAISPDGSFVVSGAGNVMKIYGHQNDNTLKVWDFETRAELFTLSGHEEAIKACAVSRDSAFIISVAEDCLMVWDARTGQKLNRFKHPGFTCSTCTDDASIAVASFFIVLVDFQSGQERSSILTDDLLHDCAISSDGARIVTAGTDQHLVVWDAKNGEQIAALKPRINSNPSGDVNACAISPDGEHIVSGGSEAILRIWNTESMGEADVLRGHTDDITACAFNHESSMLVSSSWDKTLRLWEVPTGRQLATLEGHTGPVNSCTFSPCGAYVISAGDDMTVKIWEITDLQPH